MHIEVEQKIDFRLAREFDTALYHHRTQREVRVRPFVGLVLMALAFAWMLTHSSADATVLAVAFLFFWGLQLATVAWLKRASGFVRLVRALGLGRTEIVRIDSLGASQRCDGALLQAVRWHEVGWMEFRRDGLLLTGQGISPMFISARSLPSDAADELKSFLLREWPDRVCVGRS
ncbi:hypothetical protein [Lysobacter arvi]|uniref:YcxB family protein n=1 Tax=Lysobacter arvi TaxID=3038776 RepID=A0ABU1CDV8_9GAMM|nr:hypothetical protein [Lysobacter arvi]MDR0183376.1 hypothetical protein [Lysobacter arvi]